MEEQSPVEPYSTKAQELSIEKELEKFTSGTDSLVATAPLALFAIEAAHRSAYT